jgi:hypothetical protein
MTMVVTYSNSYKDVINREIHSRSKETFNGNYICEHVKEICDSSYKNGFHKIIGFPLNDRIVYCYFASHPRHSSRSGEIVCDKKL